MSHYSGPGRLTVSALAVFGTCPVNSHHVTTHAADPRAWPVRQSDMPLADVTNRLYPTPGDMPHARRY